MEKENVSEAECIYYSIIADFRFIIFYTIMSDLQNSEVSSAVELRSMQLPEKVLADSQVRHRVQ